MRAGLFSRFCAGAALLLAFMPQGASAAVKVGVTSAVNPAARGAPRGATLKRLVIGGSILHNERVVTGPKGQTQILFLDRSTLAVGPNADMVIDRFVYDPHTKAGELVANLSQGVFRFIGGELSKHGNTVKIRTPSATLGIRGGVLLLDLKPQGGSNVIFAYGKDLTVAHRNCPLRRLRRPGFEVSLPGPQSCPSSPFPAPANEVSLLLSTLDGRQGATGGAINIPTAKTVAKSGISKNLSANLPASLAAAMAAQGPWGEPAELDPSTLQGSVNLGTVATQGPAAGFEVAPSSPALPPPPPPPPPPPSVKPPSTQPPAFAEDAKAFGFAGPAKASPLWSEAAKPSLSGALLGPSARPR